MGDASLPADTVLAELHRLMFLAAVGEASELVGSMCLEHLRTGGKIFRAQLALSAADALGVKREEALGWAAAVELLHNATLVHDDIQDGDSVRRGEPTVWARHGVPQAINAGDLMLMLPISRLIADIPAPEEIRWRLAQALCRTAEEIVRGQGADISLLSRLYADPALDAADEVVRCAEQKTAALIALCVEGAALLSRRSTHEAKRLARPFALMGVVFQLVDDIIDGYGNKGRKERGNDLREGKVSILIAEQLALTPTDRGELLPVLSTPRHLTADEDVSWALDRMLRSGAVAAAACRVEALSQRARAEVEPALANQLHAALRKATDPLASIRVWS